MKMIFWRWSRNLPAFPPAEIISEPLKMLYLLIFKDLPKQTPCPFLFLPIGWIAPTSGLLIIAKTRKLLTQLNLAFEAREIQKAYTALVHGLTPEKLQISTRIDGKDSFTSVETLQQYRRGNQDFSLLKVKPSTGRTHQIRIHLSSEGFPIAGDALYGPKSDCKKLALAATGLEFIHPATGEQLQFEIVPPDWFLPPAP